MIMFVRIYLRKSQEKKFKISGTFFVLNNIEKIKSQKLKF